MKTTLLTLLLIAFSVGLKAQNSAVTNAILYQRDGNLLKAKQNIDLAVENEKTKTQAKAWCYKGLIYSDIYKSDKVEVKELAPDALKTSTEALFKAKELENNPTGEFTKLANNQLQDNWVNLINRGIAYYQSQRFDDALEMYDMAQKINPSDTTAYVYGAFAAAAAKKADLVEKFSDKLLTLNYKSLDVYSNLINASLNKKDYNKAIELSGKALQDFPYNKAILEMRTLAYADGGRLDEGLEVVKNELKSKPYNIELLTNVAVMYNYKKDTEKAMEAYTKIIAQEPYHFFANFNSAVINFEKAKILTQKGDSAGAKALYEKSLENAKRAKKLASEDADLDNLNRLINELNTILGK